MEESDPRSTTDPTPDDPTRDDPSPSDPSRNDSESSPEVRSSDGADVSDSDPETDEIAREEADDVDGTGDAREPEAETDAREERGEGEADGGLHGESNGESGVSVEETSYEDIEIERRLLHAAESMIFAADEPVPAHRIAEIFADVTGREQPDLATVEAHVRALNQEYETTGRSFTIHEWAGGYRITTRSDFSPFVKALVVGEQETSLSRSLLETLAVLAYRQPVTRPEVDFVRGVNSDYAIRKLLDLGLADVKGRSESLGRPLLYGTTQRFLEQFGLNTLEDLPTLREIEDLLDDPSFDEERSQLLQLDTEKEITDRETAKEVLSEARERVQEGELDAEDLLGDADAGTPGEGAEDFSTGGSSEEPQSGDASTESTVSPDSRGDGSPANTKKPQ